MPIHGSGTKKEWGTARFPNIFSCRPDLSVDDQIGQIQARPVNVVFFAAT